jgi:hypothetical protein
MHNLVKLGVTAVALGAWLGSLGCSAADMEEASAESTAQALGQRCRVSGNPPVTSGCGADEFCSVVACTHSIPPTCTGTCGAAKPPPPKGGCTGAFNCLCGTPACVDDEWTCIGSCGDKGPVSSPVPPPKEDCTGAFNCLCGTPACVDGEWTCIGNCGDPGTLE